ncbi:MFS general substrate transporter [Aspergillus affinis]|uniref:MFS general substrate transporter n=1 Tax=Aspergillus affinis TaxID=1070780 RepID=UPI0022FE2939|nr:MFS general substrate transporter [Aspergillus affinis]KAI9039330.1 MFS general substrate transporter [Aspergillus affinis]
MEQRDKPTVELAEDVEIQKHTTDQTLVDSEGRVQQLPIPSTDPNDPLNFTFWEKLGVIVSCCWFSSMSLSVVGGLGAILDVFIQMYTAEGRSVNEVVWLSTFPSLFVGIGNFLILPLGLVYGRRFATLLSTTILLAATIGCAVSNTWEQHLALRIIQGLAAGATESVLPLILAEVTFVHQHGIVYGMYWCAQNVITGVLNLASSYEVAALGWRWYYWVFTIAIGIGLFIVVFAGLETSYHRGSQFMNGRLVLTDQFGVTRILSAHETQDYITQGTDQTSSNQSSHKKSYVQMLKPWTPPFQGQSLIKTIPQTWLHICEAFTSPGILYATLLSSVVLGASVGMSLSYNTVLQYSYHWAPENIGLINLGGVFGGLGGMLYAGIFGDKFVLFMARRARGIHSPEHRLPLLILPGILCIITLLLYGFTAEGGPNLTWGGPYMAWTLYQIAFVSVLILSTSFAAEAWEKNPGPALVAVVGTKNIVAFALSYGINPMVEKYSYPVAYGILAAVVGGVFVLGAPVYVWNPRWRRYMENKG